MNRTPIEWVLNPDGTPGYTWNPITGCLNGCPYCYARKLANGRLKQRYLANTYVSWADKPFDLEPQYNPFHPRFWASVLNQMRPVARWAGGRYNRKPKGIFVCDMSDLFGIGIPEEWTRNILKVIKAQPTYRFYLLTKQPQNLIKFSPFPDNCYVGVTLTTKAQHLMLFASGFKQVQAKIKYVSLEPLLENLYFHPEDIKKLGIKWVIIGAQTNPYKPPKTEWVREIVEACDGASVPVFLKRNLNSENLPFNAFDEVGLVRREMPK